MSLHKNEFPLVHNTKSTSNDFVIIMKAHRARAKSFFKFCFTVPKYRNATASNLIGKKVYRKHNKFHSFTLI